VNPGAAGRLLLLGASARALARSALAGSLARVRFPEGLLVLDFFGDADLAPERRATVIGIARDLGWPRTTAGLGRAALALAAAGRRWDAFAYAGGLENRPGLLRRLARSARLLGTDPAAVAAVRDPDVLFPFFEAEGILHPATSTRDRPGAPILDTARQGPWVFKRRRGAGGHGVRNAGAGERRRPGEYLQRRLQGEPGSVAFVADGRDARLLGATRQLAGSPALGAPEYRYAGNIAGPLEALLDATARAALERAAARLTARFGLRGLNGLDFILTGDGPAILEVNPRFTASMELLEELAGASFFDRHLAALDGLLAGAAAGTAAVAAAGAAAWLGKGILYADAAVTAPDPEALEALEARDRPHRGELFVPGQPLCTLIVKGTGESDCARRLEERARQVRALFAPAGDAGPRSAGGDGAQAAGGRVIVSDEPLSRRT
jgi:hypothetical protein